MGGGGEKDRERGLKCEKLSQHQVNFKYGHDIFADFPLT